LCDTNKIRLLHIAKNRTNDRYKANKRERMILLTVGTQFPFDRLVKAIDEAAGQNLFEEEIWAQVGQSSYQPRNFKSVKFLEKHLFEQWAQKASKVISHAGMGTITMAMENEKPLLVMPRLKKHGEVVNDHQVAIAKKFEELGHILAAYEPSDLQEKIVALKNFVPRRRKPQADVVTKRILKFLNDLCE
jgi:UDP-N-acetylglucosamine transferase subunit ALG13